MKRLAIVVSTLTVLSFVNCKTKQKTVGIHPASPTPLPTAANKTAGEIQMEITLARWPGSTAEDLREGQNIYTTKCTSCHEAHEITKFGEKKWVHEIDDMSAKAQLTKLEKLKLTKYVLSYRETKEKMKAN